MIPGHMYLTSAPELPASMRESGFLVLQRSGAHVLIYDVSSGDQCRLLASWFNEALACGDVTLAGTLDQLIRCPKCAGAVTLVRSDLVSRDFMRTDGSPDVFVSCTQCAHCEEL
jgi:hypothetical protein